MIKIDLLEQKNEKILFILAIIFVLPPIISEFLFGGSVPTVIWYFRLIDIIDITVMTVVYFILFIYLEEISVRKVRGALERLYEIFFTLFIGGHFMHFAANAINTYAYEVKGYVVGEDIPADVATALYFLDEDLSHYIMFTALMFMFLLVVLARPYLSNKKIVTDNTSRVLCILSAIIFGAALSISSIEARKAIFMLILDLSILLVILILFYKKGMIKELLKDPVSFVIVLSMVLQIVISLGYYAYFGSFVQPSELMRKHTY